MEGQDEDAFSCIDVVGSQYQFLEIRFEGLEAICPRIATIMDQP
jgi:hypothetical protein